MLNAHSLLLSFAGLVDDELLGWSRELVALGESDYALELLTAAIAAEGIRLPESVHAALRAARREPPGMELPAPDPTPAMAHRFLPELTTAGYPPTLGATFPTHVLHTLPGRLLRGCTLRLSWRLTPAGSAPAPVPHPVLLVQTTDADGVDLLAYQVADLLWQAGVFASVEVFGPDTPLGDYHRAAVDASLALEDRQRPPADAQPAPHASAGPAAAARLETGQEPVPHRLANSPAGAPGTAREPAAHFPLPPPDQVIPALASGPHTPIRSAAPFDWAPHERPAQDRDPKRAGRGGHQGPGNSAGTTQQQRLPQSQPEPTAPRPQPAGPLARTRPTPGSFAPPRGNPPAQISPQPSGQPTIPQRPQRVGTDPHRSDERGPLVPQPVHRPGPTPAQPPPTHPRPAPQGPSQDIPDTSEDSVRSPRQPLDERDIAGNTRRSH